MIVCEMNYDVNFLENDFQAMLLVMVVEVMRKTSSSLFSYLLLLSLPALKGKVERLQFITVLIISQVLLCNKDNTNYHYMARDDQINYWDDLQWMISV